MSKRLKSAHRSFRAGGEGLRAFARRMAAHRSAAAREDFRPLIERGDHVPTDPPVLFWVAAEWLANKGLTVPREEAA